MSLFVTLWPSFPHFDMYNQMNHINGIRLNSAKATLPEIESMLEGLGRNTSRLHFDVKGRQLRVDEVIANPKFLDIRLNHPTDAQPGDTVLFKAGSDPAEIGTVLEDGQRFQFQLNPKWSVSPGESIHFRGVMRQALCESSIFTPKELEKIRAVQRSGKIRNWFLSYVESPKDIYKFREAVQDDYDHVYLKIESVRGLQWVQDLNKLFVAPLPPKSNLVCAAGDLFVEVPQPHLILNAAQLILRKDPEAMIASRMMLSVCRTPTTHLEQQVRMLAAKHPDAAADMLQLISSARDPQEPDFADFAQVAWLKSIGYKNFMLCDELCLRKNMLDAAVGAFMAVR